MDPLILVSRFASELGWHGLERGEIAVSRGSGQLPVGTIVTFFRTTHPKFFIQINQLTGGVFGQYSVSIVADRYGVRPTDFVSCEFDSIATAISEARRLSPIFARSRFKDPKWRRQFRKQNPSKLRNKARR